MNKDDNYITYNKDEKINPGIWNVMPLRKGDHGTPIGLFSNTETTHRFYDELMSILSATESDN